MAERCSNDVVGITRIVDLNFRGYSDQNPKAWRGEAVVEHVNLVGGIERTNLPMKFDTFLAGKSEHLFCYIDYSKANEEEHKAWLAKIAKMDREIEEIDKRRAPTETESVAVPIVDAAAARASEEKRKAILAAKVLQHHQELAARGDAYGQWQMGHRYAVGDGVEKDLLRARSLLAMAANQGQVEAKAELDKLDVAAR